MSPWRRAERGLLRATERKMDAARPPGRLTCSLGAAYLRLRHQTLHRAIRSGGLWLPSAWRLAIALAVERSDIVLDLGANLGRVSQEGAWRVGPTGQVHAFEPAPSIADRFCRRMERLGLMPPVELNRCAVGARRGSATLYEYAHRDGGASSLRPQDHVGTKPDAERRVPMVTVDDYVEERGLEWIALIKIDVEGAEVEVLEGARRTLSPPRAVALEGRPPLRRPVLVVEAAPVTQLGFGRSVQPLLDTLSSFGYACWACRPQELAPVRTEGDLQEGRRREDLLALLPEDHADLLRRLHGLAVRRRRQ